MNVVMPESFPGDVTNSESSEWLKLENDIVASTASGMFQTET